jgi:hypothetical protein
MYFGLLVPSRPLVQQSRHAFGAALPPNFSRTRSAAPLSVPCLPRGSRVSHDASTCPTE